ncbi:SurA N-terminal domain-containing protein [Archangium violaceum]|nr:SurA N-terminal domain-containing protein [Archangium violaceum]
MRFMKFSQGAVSLLLLVCACKESGSGTPPKQEPVVARVGDSTITLQELKARLDEQPPAIRARYTTAERKKEFLENQIRVELLAQEARKQGLDKDPEVLASLERLMVQKLLQKHAATLENQPVSEAELQKYYQEHLSDFGSPDGTLAFDMVRTRIEARLKMERRSRAIDDLIANLKKSTPVEIDDKVLEQVDVQGADPKAP